MNPNKHILTRFFNKECTPKEREQVIRWLTDPANRKEVDSLMAARWDHNKEVSNSNPEVIYENIIKDISGDMNLGRTKRFHYLGISIGIAAVISLLIVFAAFFTDNQEKTFDTKITYITKSTTKGEKLTTQLPDGTRVILNSETTIEFPDRFKENERIVLLKGEAYFDVAVDTLKPFSVVSNDISVTALGTSFNVSSFDEDREMRVTLLTGKVLVKDALSDNAAFLNRGESAIFHKDTQLLKKVMTDSEKYVLWKDGILYFEKTDFNEVINTLERWYGVQFQIINQPDPTPVVYGTFDNATLKSVLRTIGFAIGFEHEIENKKITIKFKN